MKLNLTVWREARVRLETELKQLKSQSRRRRAPEQKFDFGRLFLCKAEVTRLYCLRRAVRGQLHATGRLRRIKQGHLSGVTYQELHPVTDLATQDELLRSVPGWLESFLM